MPKKKLGSRDLRVVPRGLPLTYNLFLGPESASKGSPEGKILVIDKMCQNKLNAIKKLYSILLLGCYHCRQSFRSFKTYPNLFFGACECLPSEGKILFIDK